MGDDKAGQHCNKIAPFEKADAGGQQTGNDGGLGGNDKDDAACGIKKKRYTVQPRNVLNVRLVKASKSSPPQVGLYGHA